MLPLLPLLLGVVVMQPRDFLQLRVCLLLCLVLLLLL